VLTEIISHQPSGSARRDPLLTQTLPGIGEILAIKTRFRAQFQTDPTENTGLRSWLTIEPSRKSVFSLFSSQPAPLNPRYSSGAPVKRLLSPRTDRFPQVRRLNAFETLRAFAKKKSFRRRKNNPERSGKKRRSQSHHRPDRGVHGEGINGMPGYTASGRIVD